MKKFTTLEEDLLKEAAGAQEAFEENFKEANDEILKIRVAIEDLKEKYQSDPTNWSYALKLDHVLNQFQGILLFLTDKV